MLFMKKKNLSVKTVLLNEKNRDIETPHIYSAHSALSVSTQSWVFSNETGEEYTNM